MNAIAMELEAEIEALVAPWIAKKEHINLSIGIIQGGDKQSLNAKSHRDFARMIKSWGYLNGGSSRVDGDTLFEIGSISKVFTSTLLSLLVEQGEIELKQPIAELGEVYQKLPKNITLEALATHTSGLPCIPDNLLKLSRKNTQNPYAEYTFAALNEYLQNHDGKPGKTAGSISYSNLGVGILGNVLAQHYQQSYEAAVIEKICHPLGLFDTSIDLSQEQQNRLATAYLENGKPTLHWDLPTLAGAGALRSSTNDLLTFLAANLQPEQTPITEAILATHQVRYKKFAPAPIFWKIIGNIAQLIQRSRGQRLVRFDTIGVGLGWFMEYFPSLDCHVYNHTGGTGGHSSYCGFNQTTQTGVVLLSNYAEILSSMFGQYSFDKVGMKILELASQRELRI